MPSQLPSVVHFSFAHMDASLAMLKFFCLNSSILVFISCSDAFLFSLNMVLERSAFAGARVMVDRVKPLAVCGVCGESFSPVSLYASCPKCGSYKTRLVSGQEFRLTSLIVETDK